MRKYLLALPALAVAIAALFASAGQSAEAQAAALKVRAGDGENGYSVNLFLDDNVYIRPGDTVSWSFPWPEPHSVTFGQITGDPEPPSDPGVAVVNYSGTGFVNSGLVFGGPGTPDFSVKFTTAGTYQYYCFIHPNMTGTVTVQPEGIGERDNQASLEARGQADYDSSIGTLKAAAGAMGAKPVSVGNAPGGGKKYTLAVSTDRDIAVGDVMQFFPASVNINTNDQVEWVSNVRTPHNVGIIPPGVDLSGPPPPGLETFDPFASSFGVPADGKVPGPNSLILSQVFGVDFPAGNKFALTFPTAGTYNYVCILHAAQGMVGRINVTAGTAPGAPNTGDSFGTRQDGTSGLLLIAGAVAIAVAATGGAFAVSRRS